MYAKLSTADIYFDSEYAEAKAKCRKKSHKNDGTGFLVALLTAANLIVLIKTGFIPFEFFKGVIRTVVGICGICSIGCFLSKLSKRKNSPSPNER